MTIIIDENRNGKSIKEILTKELKLSRRTITFLKTLADGITVNGEKKTVRYTLNSGETLGLNFSDSHSSAGVEAVGGELEIIYEDDCIIALNKPPFLPVHPSKRNRLDSLASRIRAYYGEKPFVFRAVNRLDRDTTGVVLVAKDRVNAELLYSQMRERKTEKTYLAVCCGELEAGLESEIDFNIRRPDMNLTLREAVPKGEDHGENSPEGVSALTGYRVLLSEGGKSLVLVTPKTGRTHQIRVHFTAIGHPLLGDDFYGEESSLIARQALHAYSLTVAHPKTGEKTTFFAPLPEDMKRVIKNFSGWEEIFDNEGFLQKE